MVDSKCHRLTASFVREQHTENSEVEVCSYYEVYVYLEALLMCFEHVRKRLMTLHCVNCHCRHLKERVVRYHYHQEFITLTISRNLVDLKEFAHIFWLVILLVL